MFQKFEIHGSKLKVLFSNIGQGLVTSDNKAPSEFEISEDGVTYHPAQAKIDGQGVLVWNDQVPNPKFVRMGWSEVVVPNLKDKNGWPVMQFTTQSK